MRFFERLGFLVFIVGVVRFDELQPVQSSIVFLMGIILVLFGDFLIETRKEVKK